MSQDKGTLKVEILQQLENAHEQLVIAATTASARGITRQGDRWCPREVLAHIVGWSTEATERIPRIIAGEPPLKYDDEAFNVAILTVLGNQSFETALEMFRQSHLRYMQMLIAQDDAVFESSHPVYRRIQAVIQHHHEHAQGLDALV